jgi:hypothetical protein
MPNQLFHWKALGKGMNLSELKGDSYYDIDKEKLTQMILSGPDWRIWINTTTGEVFFDNERLDQIKDYYNLPVDYSEGIIQYKNGNQIIQNKVVNLGSKTKEYGKTYSDIIVAHYIGYKFHHEGEKVQILIRVVPDDANTHVYMDTKVDIKVSVTNLETEEVEETIYKVVD